MTENNPSCRVRHPQHSGDDDKWYAPEDDVRNCVHGIIMGALDAAYTMIPAYRDTPAFYAISMALAKYNDDAILVAKPVPELMSELRAKLQPLPACVRAQVMQEIAMGLLAYYGKSVRRTSSTAAMDKRTIRSFTAHADLMSALPADKQLAYRTDMRLYGEYPEQLDLPVQEGEIIQPPGPPAQPAARESSIETKT